MSFGFSIGDFVLLTNLARHTVDNARKACGAHDSLTREVNSLQVVLQRLQLEVSKPDSILNRTEDNRRGELGTLARDCRRVLNVLASVLEKYNALSEEKRSVTKLWKQVRFGNGEMQYIGKIRTELATYTQAITLFLNLLAMGELGKVGKYMGSHGEELREIRHSLHWVVATAQAKSHDEKSILTSYTEDDKVVWKEFRRELIREGFSSRTLGRYKKTIKSYVLELGERGALDERETCQVDIEASISNWNDGAIPSRVAVSDLKRSPGTSTKLDGCLEPDKSPLDSDGVDSGSKSVMDGAGRSTDLRSPSSNTTKQVHGDDSSLEDSGNEAEEEEDGEGCASDNSFQSGDERHAAGVGAGESQTVKGYENKEGLRYFKRPATSQVDPAKASIQGLLPKTSTVLDSIPCELWPLPEETVIPSIETPSKTPTMTIRTRKRLHKNSNRRGGSRRGTITRIDVRSCFYDDDWAAAQEEEQEQPTEDDETPLEDEEKSCAVEAETEVTEMVEKPAKRRRVGKRELKSLEEENLPEPRGRQRDRKPPKRYGY